MKAFKPTLQVGEVNYKLLRDFELYLIGAGLSANTTAEHLNRVKVIVNELVRSGHIEYHKNPFLKFRIDTTRTVKKRIPLEDIRRLEQLELSGLDALARDMYVFSFYAAGIRFGDLCRLRKSMITDGHLHYIMHKTSVHRRIKLMPAGLKIAFAREGEFIFDTGVNWSLDKAGVARSIGSKNALLNKCLKRVCRHAGIIELSFHTSRNSFADHAKKKHMDVHTIKDMLGHSNVKTTEIYMRDFYEEETDAAFMQLFG